MNEMEDGEILSGSDVEENIYKPLLRPSLNNPASFNTCETDEDSDSSKELDHSDSDSDSDNRNKYRKMNSKTSLQKSVCSSYPQSKANNVWGSILEEESLTKELTGIGVSAPLVSETKLDRGSETYNYSVKKSFKTKNEQKTKCYKKDKSEKNLDSDYNEYWKKKSSFGRKRSIKDRLGVVTKDSKDSHYYDMPLPQPGVSNFLSPLSPTIRFLDDAEAGKDLAIKLSEPKTELLVSIVEVLGIDVCIQIYEETTAIEKNGGLVIKNGARRRTPGGLFLHLLRESKDSRIDKKALKKLFSPKETRNSQKHSFDKELEDFKKMNGKKKKLPEFDSNILQDKLSCMNNIRKPEAFQEPDAPPNSVEHSYDDLHCETEDIELF